MQVPVSVAAVVAAVAKLLLLLVLLMLLVRAVVVAVVRIYHVRVDPKWPLVYCTILFDAAVKKTKAAAELLLRRRVC